MKFPVAQVTSRPHLKTHRPAESRLGELTLRFGLELVPIVFDPGQVLSRLYQYTTLLLEHLLRLQPQPPTESHEGFFLILPSFLPPSSRTMSDEDADVLGPDGQPPARVDRDRRAPRFSWTPAYEATFFRSLCESVQLGLRENSSFKAEAWERAALALQESHGAYPAKSHLINKSDNARKRFRLWRGLREDPEFVYNPVARTVTATEEAWTAHIEVNIPCAMTMRMIGNCHHANDKARLLQPRAYETTVSSIY